MQWSRTEEGIILSDEDLVAYTLGNLNAYIELLQTGIRDICVPTVLLKTPLIWRRILSVESEGIKHLEVQFASSPDPFARGVILYKESKEKEAAELKRLFEAPEKDPAAHERIGRLLQYSTSAIESFLRRVASMKSR